MKYNFSIHLTIILSLFLNMFCFDYDANIIGILNFRGSIHRLPIAWLECLKDSTKVNFINSRPDSIVKFADLSPSMCKLIKNSKNHGTAKVNIFVDILGDFKSDHTTLIPPGLINIAYSMLESTILPKKWVDILNKKFDAVVVPDNFLVSVYRNSGVNLPIFVLPIALFLKDFLNYTKKPSHPQKVFTFACSAAFHPRKNYELLIKAFVQEFKNSPDVQLLLHGRSGRAIMKELQLLLKENKAENIKLISKIFPQAEYIKFMSSFDCFVLISVGEGFSIPPREALALGIPCILTNNTAQSTICKTGFVRSIETKTAFPAFYKIFNEYCGYQFTCSIEEVQKALRDVYQNYEIYLEKAKKSRNWVTRYDIDSLKAFYRTIVSPKNVILGKINRIDQNILVTNDEKLYTKYKSLNTN